MEKLSTIIHPYNVLRGDKLLEFSYRLQAKFPLTVQTSSSSAYDARC